MKKWYLSRSLWVNAIMLAGVVIFNATGQDILTPEVQGAIITVVNVILRVITNEELTL